MVLVKRWPKEEHAWDLKAEVKQQWLVAKDHPCQRQ